MQDESPRWKAALVTGASSGIGQAVVRGLRARNITVYAVARRADRLARLAAETGAQAIVLDVQDTPALYEKLSHLEVDVLVNNAGVGRGFVGLLSVAPEEIDRTIGTNVLGALHVARAVIPGMVVRKHGHVFTVGSVAGLYPIRSALYGASKGAIHLFASNLRLELVGSGVRHTEIVPGRVQTEFLSVAIDDPALRAKLDAEITELSAEDIARCIMFALDAPANVDVTTLEVLPTEQAIGGVQLVRGPRT